MNISNIGGGLNLGLNTLCLFFAYRMDKKNSLGPPPIFTWKNKSAFLGCFSGKSLKLMSWPRKYRYIKFFMLAFLLIVQIKIQIVQQVFNLQKKCPLQGSRDQKVDKKKRILDPYRKNWKWDANFFTFLTWLHIVWSF